jgi:alpha-amylase
MTPSEVAEELQPVSAISIPSPISWADEERDITAWLGNELQIAASDKLYELSEKVKKSNDEKINRDFEFLQSSDHFYYMATKFFSDGAVHAYFNPYETPYDAFMNYMNVLSDFEIRLNRFLPLSNEQLQIVKLESVIKEKDKIIEKQAEELLKQGGKILKTKGKKSSAGKGKTKTSLKELAHKLISQTSARKPPAKPAAAAVTKKRAVVKKKAPKSALKKSSSRAVPKKSTPKKVVKTIKKKEK